VLDKPDDVLPLTSLSAVSAVDGRYADTTAPLRRYFSEVNVALCVPVLQMSCLVNLTQYVTVSFTYLHVRFQFALIHHRVFIEIKWLQLLSRLDTIPAVRGVWIDSMRASIGLIIFIAGVSSIYRCVDQAESYLREFFFARCHGT